MAGAGYRDWSPGDVPTANQFDTYLQHQTVMDFDSAAVRDTALSAVKAEGMYAHLDDANTLTACDGTNWSSIGPVYGAWIDWTPTLSQGGAVTKTVTRARYRRLGREVTFTCALAVTGTGTSSTKVTVSLPVAASITGVVLIGQGYIVDSSPGGFFMGMVSTDSSSSTAVMYQVTSNNGTAATNWLMGSGASAFNAALASGDIVMMSGTYEADADA